MPGRNRTVPPPRMSGTPSQAQYEGKIYNPGVYTVLNSWASLQAGGIPGVAYPHSGPPGTSYKSATHLSCRCEEVRPNDMLQAFSAISEAESHLGLTMGKLACFSLSWANIKVATDLLAICRLWIPDIGADHSHPCCWAVLSPVQEL